jgi:hypothetical protein
MEKADFAGSSRTDRRAPARRAESRSPTCMSRPPGCSGDYSCHRPGRPWPTINSSPLEVHSHSLLFAARRRSPTRVTATVESRPTPDSRERRLCGRNCDQFIRLLGECQLLWVGSFTVARASRRHWYTAPTAPARAGALPTSGRHQEEQGRIQEATRRPRSAVRGQSPVSWEIQRSRNSSSSWSSSTDGGIPPAPDRTCPSYRVTMLCRQSLPGLNRSEKLRGESAVRFQFKNSTSPLE